MNAWIKNTLILWLLSLAALEAAPVEANISSAFLARGEKTLMEIRFDGIEPDSEPIIPRIEGVSIEALDYGRLQQVPGRRVQFGFQYLVSSYSVGKHVVPEIEVTVSGVSYKTNQINLEIFNPNDLQWGEAISTPNAASDTLKFASIIKVPDQKIYKNQTVRSEIKVYIPRELARNVADWGVPEFERDGLAVWRYEATVGRGEVNLLGQSYISVAYSSTMSGLKSGKVKIGPATVRLTYIKMIIDRFAQRIEMQATLDVPEYEFEIQPLPEGAPEGFDNAVGEFTLGSAIKQTEIKEGDPLSLDVIVTGNGNLDVLRSPEMIDSSGWKIYDSTPSQRGEERRDLYGSIIFSQFLRPLEMKTSVPAFRLVYFDPKLEKYKTVMTDPIPITMTPATVRRGLEVSGPPQSLATPIERMTDILGLVNSENILTGKNQELPWKYFQIPLVVIALILILKAFWMRLSHRFERDETKTKIKKDLQEVIGLEEKDELIFLRGAGKFVEKWLSPEKDEELAKILEERDSLCFRESKNEANLPKKRRQEILRALRRAAFGLILFVFTLPTAQGKSVSKQAKEAYDSAKYEQAAKLWLDAGPFEKLSADTLYNIGNAAYRMGDSGEAALYYRRALSRDGSHREARQNLRFIERKYGSITVQRPAYQYALASISLDDWKRILYTGGWMLLISILIFPATRSGSRLKICGVIGLIIAPLILTIGTLGFYHYPNDAEFAPIAKQAVIVGEKVVLHTDAARTSPEVIDAPPGSLAEIIRESGQWAYVSFATKTRGWVPMESVRKIIPYGKPEAPKVRKSESDGSSA